MENQELAGKKYIERYGTSPVWSDYRRNHKGGIPPQKTRKTCIFSSERRQDMWEPLSNLSRHQHHPLSECEAAATVYQSIYRILYDPTRTGVCQKQKKQLNQAIGAARDHGLLPFQVPQVDFSGEDYSNSHDAVGSTPPPPTMTPWYRWYYTIQPDETEVAKVKKTYKAYLK
ncbi:hypothetical protein J4Q44_G00062940 [Coregonus suidteri]|uniref:Small ribosomal subunit protein mS40 n=1 Tax=Coregonus suidteri TaxID=861788 RepID=A0AAN8M395_9TELE